MRILAQLPEAPAEAVVTVGNFDGLHRGHRLLLQAVRRQATARGWRAVAVSFEPHPNRILHPDTAVPLITPLPEKLRLFEATGVDDVVLLPFTRDLSLLPPREFVERILLRGVGMRSLHEGETFRFGHRHSGDGDTLRMMADELGFEVHLHSVLRVRGEVVSSSRVRSLVTAGEVERARCLLGRLFAVRGRIARGRGIGRQRTVPTLNLEHYEELLPRAGVYLTFLSLGGAVFEALTNVGIRPTFGPGALTVETYILEPPAEGLDPQVGDEMEIAFVRRLRDEVKFESAEELRQAIVGDVSFARRFFARLARQRARGNKLST